MDTDTTIEPLPQAIRDRVRSHVATWTQRMYSTQRPDQPAVEQALARLYSSAGWSAPRWVVWTDSPVAAQYTVDLIMDGGGARTLQSRLSQDLRDRYRAGLERQVDPEFWAETRRLDGVPTDIPWRDRARRMMSDPHLARVVRLSGVFGPVTAVPGRLDLWFTPAARVTATTSYSLAGETDELQSWITRFTGQRIRWHRCAELVCREFGRDPAPISWPHPRPMYALDLAPAQIASWIMGSLIGSPAAVAHARDVGTVIGAVSYAHLFPAVAVLAQNPTILRTNKEGLLHGDPGPALEFADGIAQHWWRGRCVPATAIERPVTVERIMCERNTEVRRCLIERMGWPELIAQAHLAPVGPPVPDPGNPPHTLQLFDLPKRLQPVQEGRRIAARVLLCTNGTAERDGTRRRYGLLVRATHSDPVAAAADMYGVSVKTYRRMQIRV
ncbi:DUF6745 domain-containing protein [Nocardia transvalensis]|uniref:DUF6745 domain-containing protein n=1 Tax=Nocardia transvalensis TaxID=37333 RepID=UPI001893A386|nr:hypothetical protein [Nocardia transvalensis]MBF6333565.1 hypothetical protein [Nocardia transvalensis]